MADRTKKILIIDDNPHIAELLSVKLNADGYQTFKALNGLEGIKVALKEIPDLILLDVLMPQMNGYQVCRFLKSVPALRRARIVFITVKKGSGDRQRGLLRGGDEYLVKPFDMKELEEKIRQQLEVERPHFPMEITPAPGLDLPSPDAITDQVVVSVMNQLLDENICHLTLLEEVSRRLVAAVDREAILRMVVASVISEVGLGWDRVLLMMVDYPQRLLQAELAVGIYEQPEEGLKRWQRLTAAIKDWTLEEVLDSGLERFDFQARDREEWLDRLTLEVDPEKLSLLHGTALEGLENLRAACSGNGLERILESVFGIREVSAVPIVGKEKILGLLVADRSYSHRGVRVEDLHHLWILAHQAGLALERDELYQREDRRAQELERLNLLNDSIMNGIDLGIIFIDRLGKIGRWNRAMFEFTGLSEKEASGRALFKLFPKLEQTLVGDRFKKAQSSGRAQRVGHYQHTFRKGRVGIFDVRIGVVQDKGEHLGTVLIWEDVQQRIELEQSAQETLQYLSNLIDHSGDAILTIDTRGKIKSWNQGAEAIFGYGEAEVLGHNFSLLYETGSKGEARQLLRQTIQRGKVLNLEENLFRKDGQMVNVGITTSTIMDLDGQVIAVTAIIRDTSERKRMESQLFQTEKLASLGIMAAGMAHEINNPLTSIMMYAQILSMRQDMSEEDRNCLEKIEEDVSRIADIVNSLLVFSRPSSRQQEDVDVHEVLDKAVSFIEYQSAVRNISVLRSYGAQAPTIKGIQNEIQEIFLNLLVNARDALPDGGEIRVTTSYHTAGEESTPEFPGGHIKVSVADNGTGIPKESLKKIFDPFFTTKPPGKGTGLGLAVVRRLVDNHQGHITVRSQPGKGTTFTVFFPLS